MILRLTYYQNAMVLARQLDNRYWAFRLQGLIAGVHTIQKKFALAEQELLAIVKDEKKVGPLVMMVTYDQLTDLYLINGEYDKALKYGLETQKVLPLANDSSQADVFCARLAYVYNVLGKPLEYQEWIKKSTAIKIARLLPGQYRQLSDIVSQLRQQEKPGEALELVNKELSKNQPTTINDQRLVHGNLADLYNDLKMYGEAEKNYIKMIRLADQQKNEYPSWEKGYDNLSIGKFYYKRGQYRSALPFLEKSLKNYEVYGGLQQIRGLHIWLYRNDSALGNYLGSLEHLKESNRINDSIFNIQRNKQVEQLQIAYKTEQKDKNIIQLAAKEKLAQVQLLHSASTRSWIVGAALLLSIIAALFYRLAYLRKRNNLTINNKNYQLQNLLREKEWLLKEVHHRVKNNLHSVIGLLECQAAYLQDDALQANEVSKHRIYAMSLIHQQLYNAEDIKSIDMSIYLTELLEYLENAFGITRRIRFVREIEPLQLGISQAIPIGLIVNEAVTNAIKYAFPRDTAGAILVSLQQEWETIQLIIADDGVGIHPDIIKTPSASLGLKLMKGLSDDMQGVLRVSNEHGTKVEVSFRPDPLHDFNTHELSNAGLANV